MAANIEKMKELFADEKLAKEVLAIENAEDAQEWFSDHGVELTMAEVNGLAAVLNRIASGELTEEQLKQAASGELSEEELTGVAGGLGGLDSQTVKECLVTGSVMGVISGLTIGGMLAAFFAW